MPELTVEMSDPVPPGRPLLLAPRILDAFGFRCDGLQIEHGELVAEVTASNSGQRAFVIRPTAPPARPVLRYRLSVHDGPPPEWIWTPPDPRYVRASPELGAFVRDLVRGAHSEAETLRRIVAHAGEVLWYGHGPGNLMDGRDSVPLLTRPTRGHCVDMHGYCVAASRAAGLTAAYCAGFWFKAGSRRAPGMHCWFVALVHYDVSHQLKVPVLPIEPGLNPIPGVRALAAAGKGHAFQTPLGEVRVDHFARLVWRTEDGRDHYPAHELDFDAGIPGAALEPVPLAEPAC
jgi:hypothetical protein